MICLVCGTDKTVDRGAMPYCHQHRHFSDGRTCPICGAHIINSSKTGYCNSHRPRSGPDNPMYGKSIRDVWLSKLGEEGTAKREAEHRARLGESSQKKWTDASYRSSVIASNTGKQRSEEFKSQQRTNAKKQMQDLSQRELRSRTMSDTWYRGALNPDHIGSNCYGKRGYYEGHFYMSKVELVRIKKFIAEGVTWKRYIARDFDWRIQYEWNGRWHTYIPDFVIETPSGLIIEEIKCRESAITPQDRAKIAAAESFLPTVGIRYRVIVDPSLPLGLDLNT